MPRPLFFLLLAVPALAQSRVTVRTAVVWEDEGFDADTGSVLASSKEGDREAEWMLEKKDGSFRLSPAGGTMREEVFCTLDAFASPLDVRELARNPVPLAAPRSIVGRTSGGKVYKATLWPSWIRFRGENRERRETSDPCVFVEYALQQDGTAEFGALPGRVEAGATGEGIRVAWTSAADGPWRIDWSLPDGTGAGWMAVASSPALITGLPEGLYRLSVAKVAPDGGSCEPRATVAHTSHSGVARHEIELGTIPDEGLGIDLRSGKTGLRDADLVVLPKSLRAPAGGGVVFVGADDAALPEWGYGPIEDLAAGTYAVRLRDGRSARACFTPIGSGYSLSVAVDRGGRLAVPEQTDFRGQYVRNRLKLSWSPRPGAAKYRISRVIEGVSYPMTATKETSIVLERFERRTTLTLVLESLDEVDGASDPASLTISTWPPDYRRGEFEIDTEGREGFDFATGEVVADEGDLRFSRETTIATPHGSFYDTEREFGKFRRRDVEGLRELCVNESSEATLFTIYVALKTGEDGFAHVQITRVTLGRARFRYVYLPPLRFPPVPEMARDLLDGRTPPDSSAAAEIARTVRELSDDDPGVREDAARRLAESGPTVAGVLAEEWARSEDPEVKATLAAVLQELWQADRD